MFKGAEIRAMASHLWYRGKELDRVEWQMCTQLGPKGLVCTQGSEDNAQNGLHSSNNREKQLTFGMDFNLQNLFQALYLCNPLISP